MGRQLTLALLDCQFTRSEISCNFLARVFCRQPCTVGIKSCLCEWTTEQIAKDSEYGPKHQDTPLILRRRAISVMRPMAMT